MQVIIVNRYQPFTYFIYNNKTVTLTKVAYLKSSLTIHTDWCYWHPSKNFEAWNWKVRTHCGFYRHVHTELRELTNWFKSS